MIKKIGIVGFGQMGSGIAQVSAAVGYKVIGADVSDDTFKKGMSYIGKSLDKGIEKGKLTPADKEKVLANISHAGAYDRTR